MREHKNGGPAWTHRLWSALLATPALKRLLIFKDLAPGHQRRRRRTTPALTLSLTLCGITPSPILLGASTLCFLPRLMSGVIAHAERRGHGKMVDTVLQPCVSCRRGRQGTNQ